MLGPELVNHVIKPTPLFSTGTPSLQLTHPVPRELGLSNYQTINALIQSNSAGLLYLKMNNRGLSYLSTIGNGMIALFSFRSVRRLME